MSSSRAVHFGDGKVHVQRKRDHDILRGTAHVPQPKVVQGAQYFVEAIPAEPKRVELSAVSKNQAMVLLAPLLNLLRFSETS